jgi:hypothetical protein
VPASGMTSGHLVLLSTTVNRCVWPELEAGRCRACVSGL